ncbi:MAG: Nif3-like dinuclear metal center hexameric protein [Clostridia bacterium]|nr:Nif3-like dinuclear metal center hexameric protein [Clostridia bacterium]
MNVKELYAKFNERIPDDLRESWDNDGIMCCADGSQDVARVLVTLDVTEEIVDFAISSHFDLIVSHHPLIFKPLSAVTEDNHIARKIIKLLDNGVSVFSFHTRLDKVTGGVNDQLCDILGMFDTVPFGDGFLGRIGNMDEKMELEDFVYKLKQSIGADMIRYSDAFNPVSRVAVVGGDGKGYVRDAIAAGADTFVSGRIGYNMMEEAAELGINLIEAGHYYTEQPVTDFLRELLCDFDPSIYVEIASSNVIRTL